MKINSSGPCKAAGNGGDSGSLQTDRAAQSWGAISVCELSQVSNVDSNVLKPHLQPKHNKAPMPAQDLQP